MISSDSKESKLTHKLNNDSMILANLPSHYLPFESEQVTQSATNTTRVTGLAKH